MHVIVAVNSGSNGDIDVLARTDLVAGWIAGQIAAHKLVIAYPNAARRPSLVRWK